MKKTLFFVGAMFLSLFAQAQNFHIEEANNPDEIYLNGDVVEVGELGDIATDAGFFSFKVRNISNDTIKVRAKLVEVVNGNPEALQFCFSHDCYTNIVIDRVYPTDGQYAEILAGATHKDTDFDHIVNFYEPDNGENVDYTFRFFEVNDDLEEIGDPLLITYRYNPTLSTPDFKYYFALINSTILTNALDIKLENDADLRMYDMLGREVFAKSLVSGTHHLTLPNLTNNMYFVQLSNKEGAQQTIKVLVK